jgi:hypothetical protein
MITLQKVRNMILLKKPEMQGAKFSRNETYLLYVAVTGKLKQRRRLGFFSRIMNKYIQYIVDYHY